MNGLALFLTTPIFHFVLVPLGATLLGILARAIIGKGDITWTTFAVGVELVIAAMVGLPAVIGEKVSLLKGQSSHLSPAQILDTTNQILVEGWALFLVLALLLLLCLYEMRFGLEARDPTLTVGVFKPLCLGVLIPTGLGLLSLLVFFYAVQ